jgi:hypothetical protein
MSIRKQDRPNTVSRIIQNARKDDAKALIRKALSLATIPVKYCRNYLYDLQHQKALHFATKVAIHIAYDSERN